MRRKTRFPGCWNPAVLAVVLGTASGPLAAQDALPATSLTIYSSARPGAVPAELYRPVPGSGAYFGQSVPGYAVIRQSSQIELGAGRNQYSLTDVAAYIDPTTVRFESRTDPTTRVLEQAFQFDLVNTQRLMQRYTDQIITVDQRSADGMQQITGRLLSSDSGLILAGDDGRIHSINDYSNIHFPELPGGLMTRPTLVWEVVTNRAGTHDIRVSYQTTGITWWADYNLTFTPGPDANSGYLDLGAWVSILNRSGASYGDAQLKLIAGDVNRAEPSGPMVMRALEQGGLAADATGGFEERGLFEFHLYTLGRSTTIPDNSTRQIELLPVTPKVPARKLLVYYGEIPRYGFDRQPITDRDFGLPMNTKVDVYLEFKNEEAVGLGIPLPAGRIRVSQLDESDESLELIGEDIIDHTPKDEDVLIKLGSAFDVVGNRRQVDFQIDVGSRRMEEVIEVAIRNHKPDPVEVIVKETLFLWADNDIVQADSDYERFDNSTVHFPVMVTADGETVVRYRVRYTW